MCFLEKKGSLAGKLASKKYDIIIAQALSKLRECIDVLKTYDLMQCFLETLLVFWFLGYRADVISYTFSSKLAVSYV